MCGRSHNEGGTIMSEYKLKTGKIGDAVVGAYKAVESTVVGGYKAVEDTVVGSYKKVEDAFVDAFLVKTDEPAAKEQDKY